MQREGRPLEISYSGVSSDRSDSSDSKCSSDDSSDSSDSTDSSYSSDSSWLYGGHNAEGGKATLVVRSKDRKSCNVTTLRFTPDCVNIAASMYFPNH